MNWPSSATCCLGGGVDHLRDGHAHLVAHQLPGQLHPFKHQTDGHPGQHPQQDLADGCNRQAEGIRQDRQRPQIQYGKQEQAHHERQAHPIEDGHTGGVDQGQRHQEGPGAEENQKKHLQLQE